jgi:hypothetical protein
MSAFEITLYTKRGGRMTKSISLVDGKLHSDPAACAMSEGTARRVELDGVLPLAELIKRLKRNEALGLGVLRSDPPDEVKVTTRTKLEQMNGAVPPGMIARTHDDIVYREKQRAFALLDFDTKGMPPEVAAKIKEAGGFFEALITVSPSLRGAARVTRASTSDDQARFGRQIHANKKRTFVEPVKAFRALNPGEKKPPAEPGARGEAFGRNLPTHANAVPAINLF